MDENIRSENLPAATSTSELTESSNASKVSHAPLKEILLKTEIIPFDAFSHDSLECFFSHSESMSLNALAVSQERLQKDYVRAIESPEEEMKALAEHSEFITNLSKKTAVFFIAATKYEQTHANSLKAFLSSVSKLNKNGEDPSVILNIMNSWNFLRLHYEDLVSDIEANRKTLAKHSHSVRNTQLLITQRNELLLDEYTRRADELKAQHSLLTQKHAEWTACKEREEQFVSIVLPKRLLTLHDERFLASIQKSTLKAEFAYVEAECRLRRLLAEFAYRVPKIHSTVAAMNELRLEVIEHAINWYYASVSGRVAKGFKHFQISDDLVTLKRNVAPHFDLDALIERGSSTSSVDKEVRLYVHTPARERAFSLDMWGKEGVRNCKKNIENSKNVMRVLESVLKDWVNFLDVKDSHEQKLLASAEYRVTGEEESCGVFMHLAASEKNAFVLLKEFLNHSCGLSVDVKEAAVWARNSITIQIDKDENLLVAVDAEQKSLEADVLSAKKAENSKFEKRHRDEKKLYEAKTGEDANIGLQEAFQLSISEYENAKFEHERAFGLYELCMGQHLYVFERMFLQRSEVIRDILSRVCDVMQQRIVKLSANRKTFDDLLQINVHKDKLQRLEAGGEVSDYTQLYVCSLLSRSLMVQTEKEVGSVGETVYLSLKAVKKIATFLQSFSKCEKAYAKSLGKIENSLDLESLNVLSSPTVSSALVAFAGLIVDMYGCTAELSEGMRGVSDDMKATRDELKSQYHAAADEYEKSAKSTRHLEEKKEHWVDIQRKSSAELAEISENAGADANVPQHKSLLEKVGITQSKSARLLKRVDSANSEISEVGSELESAMKDHFALVKATLRTYESLEVQRGKLLESSLANFSALYNAYTEKLEKAYTRLRSAIASIDVDRDKKVFLEANNTGELVPIEVAAGAMAVAREMKAVGGSA